MKAEIKCLDNPEIFRINQLDAHSDHNYYQNYLRPDVQVANSLKTAGIDI